MLNSIPFLQSKIAYYIIITTIIAKLKFVARLWIY